MKLRIPINKITLKHHFTYNLWKYILLVIVSIFFVDIVYSTTAYRSPEDKRIDIYIQGAISNQSDIDDLFEEMRIDFLPEVEVIRSAFLLSGSQDDMYAAQQLTTYLAVGEGDLYLLEAEDFKRYAAQGVFIDLSQAIEDGILNTKGIDLSSGYVAIQEYDMEKDRVVIGGEKRLYGIPAASLDGLLSEFGIFNQDLFIAMTVFNGNDENVLRFFNELINRTHRESSENQLVVEGLKP
ncbi:MAG: hypothetical protein GX781_00775 [Clostridiales bacterium]|nr:hypothetical protein [Clostridiales bacterium]